MEFTESQQRLIDLWESHTAAEFELKDADAAVATMTDDVTLTHVPSGTGATGKEALRAFYRDVFIPQCPDDMELELITRTVVHDRVVDEFVLHFTHDRRMEWMTPGIEPTGRKLVVPHVGIVGFRENKIISEHIYWDQGTVLRQMGVLGEGMPVMGSEQANRVRDPSATPNELIGRFGGAPG
ncbi:MAG: nuclear transport factor 2 family protein [Myxococcota bacterium]